jgi:hypothetical protein
VGDDGTGFTDGLQVIQVEDTKGNVLPTPQQTFAPLTASDIDGVSLTPDAAHGAVIDGSSKVFFFSLDPSRTITVLPATVNVSAFGTDGDSVASLPGGDEVVVSAGSATELALISDILSGSPVIAESIATSKRAPEYDGVLISSDGKVMLSRAAATGLLDVYSVAAVTPHPGSLGGTVAFSFTLTNTLTVPPLFKASSETLGGRDGMALSPTDSSRAVVVSSDGSVTLITGLPASPVIGGSLKLASGATSVSISADGKYAIVAVAGGLVVVSGVDTGTLAQVGLVFSPTFSTPAGSCQLTTPATVGVTADGRFVVTIQNCGLTKSSTNVGSGVLLTIPFSGGTLSAPVGQLNFVVTPSDDQIVTQ